MFSSHYILLFSLHAVPPLGVATVANWTANAVVIASYLSVVETLGQQNTFVIYAVSAPCGVCCIVIQIMFHRHCHSICVFLYRIWAGRGG